LFLKRSIQSTLLRINYVQRNCSY